MRKVIVIDSAPLGLVTHPKLSGEALECNQWLRARIRDGDRVILPEIADYEVRRELLRGNKDAGLAILDDFCRILEYLPITTAAMRQACVFWAMARKQGRPTADDKALDGDVNIGRASRTAR